MRRRLLISACALVLGGALGIGVAGWPENVDDDVLIDRPATPLGETVPASAPVELVESTTTTGPVTSTSPATTAAPATSAPAAAPLAEPPATI